MCLSGDLVFPVSLAFSPDGANGIAQREQNPNRRKYW